MFMAKYKIVCVPNARSTKPAYIVKARWLCFWYTADSWHYDSTEDAEGAVQALVQARERSKQRKTLYGVIATYDENGNTCK
jgi:hypothetical protein